MIKFCFSENMKKNSIHKTAYQLLFHIRLLWKLLSRLLGTKQKVNKSETLKTRSHLEKFKDADASAGKFLILNIMS